MCFDLNTMTMIWAQDVLDDTNSTPVFEESREDGTCYIYISTSLAHHRHRKLDPQRRHPRLEDKRRYRRDRVEDPGLPLLHHQRGLRRGAGHPGPRQGRYHPTWSSTPSPAPRGPTPGSWSP